jgi:quercetin dioxygenase-like cupin family protein
MRILVLVIALGCGSSQAPAPAEPAAPPPREAESETPATAPPSDPTAHRFATVIPAGKVPVTLWQDATGAGKLVAAAPAPAADRMAVALTATSRCEGASTCSFYEHTVPSGQQRAASPSWRDYGPDRRFAALWGNLESGPFGVLVEVKAGTAPFWHMHGRDVRMIVLAGTVEFRESGHPVQALAPGSYVQQSGGYKHTEGCAAGADCVLYVHGDRGFDVKPL